MTAATFPVALAFTLQSEGGWSDNPADHGGATNKGITLRTFQSFQPGANANDLRNISDATVATIYRRQYWDVMRCDALPAGVDLSVFDFGVNAGPQRSVRLLQQAVGVTADGINRAQTQAATEVMGVTTTIQRLHDAQVAYYKSLTQFPIFGEGWLSRSALRRQAALDATHPRGAAAPPSDTLSERRFQAALVVYAAIDFDKVDDDAEIVRRVLAAADGVT